MIDSSTSIGEKPADANRVSGKSAQIVLAATRLFLEQGYSVTSVDAVANEAKVSKSTLYVYFRSKAELFAAVVGMSGDGHTTPLILGVIPSEDFQTTLLRLARAILRLLLAPETVGSYRMVMAEVVRSPELGRIYHENGALRMLDRLETIFDAAMKEGKLLTAHPRRAAENFVGLIRSDLVLRTHLGLQKQVSKAEREDRIKGAVAVFYRAYRPDQAMPQVGEKL